MLDFHNHLIPAVDDGSSSLEQSLAALEKMSAQGITHVITTPHFLASTLKQPLEFKSQMDRIDDSWRLLADSARRDFPQIKLDRGVELALDDPTPMVTDARVRLAGTRFALVEFPYFSIPPASTRALAHLKASGVTPIVAHPERYEDIERNLGTFHEWKQAGAFLQLNAGSVAGAYGARVEQNAWQCLRMGIIDFVSSDYHARGECLVTEAHHRLLQRLGASQLKILAAYNGDRLLQGLDPLPVPPLSVPDSRWRRLIRAFRWRWFL